MLGWFSLTENAAPGEADRLMTRLAADLVAAGLRVAGAVQRNTDLGAGRSCDMDVVVIGEEERPIRISQSLGPGAEGCRLDAGALEMAAGRVVARIGDAGLGTDLLLVPKFGRQEAAGRGFRQLIAQAVATGLPVLLYVPPEQRDDFAAFGGGMAEWVPPEGLAQWCLDPARRQDPRTNLAQIIDARDLLCPLPVLRLRKALLAAPTSARLALIATDPMAQVDVPHFCATSGHVMIALRDLPDGARAFVVERGPGPDIAGGARQEG